MAKYQYGVSYNHRRYRKRSSSLQTFRMRRRGSVESSRDSTIEEVRLSIKEATEPTWDCARLAIGERSANRLSMLTRERHLAREKNHTLQQCRRLQSSPRFRSLGPYPVLRFTLSSGYPRSHTRWGNSI